MNRGRAIILNPSRPDSVKRREFLLDSLTRSALAYTETVEADRIVIEWAGEPKPERKRAPHKRALPPPVTVDKALRSRFNCEPDDVEYWDEMIRLAAEREGLPTRALKTRSKWETEQWRETWGVAVGEHLAVNRAVDYWAITHVPSGLLAAQANTLRAALTLARQVAHWPEWATIRTKADVTPEFARRAKAAFGGAVAA